MRILIVEDEVRLAQNIAQLLREREHYAVDVAHNGTDGLHLLTSEAYDLAILDWLLPGTDGLGILEAARKQAITVPILFLTARDAPADIVTVLNSGGDDYLTKPFDMGELVARCKALLRRASGRAVSAIEVGPLRIDTTAKTVHYDGRAVILTAMEYQLLEYLAARSGQILSKEELLEHLYDFNWERFSNVIEVYISNLRKKLDPDKRSNPIVTLRGQGYCLLKEP